MDIIVISAVVSFCVSFIMMKWHIHNASILFKKHLEDSDNLLKEQMANILNSLIQRKHQ